MVRGCDCKVSEKAFLNFGALVKEPEMVLKCVELVLEKSVSCLVTNPWNMHSKLNVEMIPSEIVSPATTSLVPPDLPLSKVPPFRETERESWEERGGGKVLTISNFFSIS